MTRSTTGNTIDVPFLELCVLSVWNTLSCFSFCVWTVALCEPREPGAFLVECLLGLKMKQSDELLSRTAILFFSFCTAYIFTPHPFSSLTPALLTHSSKVFHLPDWTTSLLSSRLEAKCILDTLRAFGLFLFLSLFGHGADSGDLKLLWVLRNGKLSFHTQIEKKGKKSCTWPLRTLSLWAMA